MLKPTMGGRVRQPVHYFTRFQNGGSITALTGTTTTFGAIYWDLASVPGYTEYSNMYDFYKINAVQVRFIPQTDNTDPITASWLTVSAKFNRLITVLDYNDRTVPTSLDDLRQYSNCKVASNNYVAKRFLHPKPTITMDEDATSGGVYGIGQSTRTPWVSTASNQCEWYGIKYGIEHGSMPSDASLYKLEFKLYLSFKGRN